MLIQMGVAPYCYKIALVGRAPGQTCSREKAESPHIFTALIGHNVTVIQFIQTHD